MSKSSKKQLYNKISETGDRNQESLVTNINVFVAEASSEFLATAEFAP